MKSLQNDCDGFFSISGGLSEKGNRYVSEVKTFLVRPVEITQANCKMTRKRSSASYASKLVEIRINSTIYTRNNNKNLNYKLTVFKSTVSDLYAFVMLVQRKIWNSVLILFHKGQIAM